MKTFLTITGIVVAAIIALGAWFFPFHPVGPSPLAPKESTDKAKKKNLATREEAENWNPTAHIEWGKTNFRLLSHPPNGWNVGLNLPDRDLPGKILDDGPGLYEVPDWWGADGPKALAIRLHGPDGVTTTTRIVKRKE
jgi:hypothetical protein